MSFVFAIYITVKLNVFWINTENVLLLSLHMSFMAPKKLDRKETGI